MPANRFWIHPGAALVAGLSLAALPAAQQPWAAPATGPVPLEAAAGGRVFREDVQVRFVVLHATVLNRKGKTVLGLGPDDFHVTEDGVPQEISVFGSSENQPAKIAFLLDVSGSMSLRKKLEQARRAIERFVTTLEPNDQMALLIFADGDVVIVQGFTADRRLFVKVLEEQKAYGKTALRDALAYAPSLLAGNTSGRKALVVITDGIDNASRLTSSEIIRMARQVQVPIYTLGISGLPLRFRRASSGPKGSSTLFDQMREFSRETGGDLWPVFESADFDAVFSSIRGRLAGQYIIGYRPPPHAGVSGFRRVELRTSQRSNQVFTRRGYYVKN
ncbi:MAG: VWA domain-containing protein [Acidobacteriota bacterium]